MREIIKQVTVSELYDILLKKSKKPVSREDFLFQLMNSFLLSPALELRFHDREKASIDLIYVLKHQEIAKALEEKKNAQKKTLA
jgi:hypothetical protein